MSTPYIGEIRMFAGNFAPLGWARCQGQLMPIAQYTTLYTLIGTTYGGDGVSTFALPDLQGRAPVNQGQGAGLSNFIMGEKAGTETVTLISGQIPSHSHAFVAGTAAAGGTSDPTNQLLAQPAAIKPYSALPGAAALAPQSLGVSGGTQPHENMQPFLALNFIIALDGIFPSQN